MNKAKRRDKEDVNVQGFIGDKKDIMNIHG